MGEKKTVGRKVILGIGVICIILTAGLAGTISYYNSTLNSKDFIISYLSGQVNDLNSQIANLQSQISNLRGQSNSTNSQNSLNGAAASLSLSTWHIRSDYSLNFYVYDTDSNIIAAQPSIDSFAPCSSVWNSHTGYTEGAGNLFTGNGAYLGYSQFMLARWGGNGTVGRVRAAIFDASTLPPSNVTLTKSTNTININSLSTKTAPVGTECTFTFDGTLQLVSGHQYLVAFYIESGTVSNGNGIVYWIRNINGANSNYEHK